MYTVKFKKSLKEFYEILMEQQIEVNIISDFQIEANPKNEIERDVFIRVLSYFIIYVLYKDMLKKALIKKGMDENIAEEIAIGESNFFKESTYFSNITRILLLEYFKNIKTINLNSFSIFNMNGFKEEIQIMADNIFEYETKKMMDNNYNQTRPLIDLLLDDEDEPNYYEPSVNNLNKNPANDFDLFSAVKQNAILSGLNMDDYSDINVLVSNGRIVYKNKNGVLLDMEFFLTQLGISLDFSDCGNDDDREIIEDLLVFSVLRKIFDIKTVIIHKNLSDTAIELFLLNIDYNKDIKKPEIVYCEGCSDCLDE